MNRTGIAYLDFTWNPIAMRCTPVSPACDNCWHLATANRMAKNPKIDREIQARYRGDMPPVMVGYRLDEPLRRKTPAVIGVQFMGDLFHEDVPFKWIDEVFGVMAVADWHTFLVLTKRPERAAAWFADIEGRQPSLGPFGICTGRAYLALGGVRKKHSVRFPTGGPWPLPSVAIGITAEDQKRADERIPVLLNIPARWRFVSCEPLLSMVQLRQYLKSGKGDYHEKERNGISQPGGDRDILYRQLRQDMEASQDSCRKSTGGTFNGKESLRAEASRDQLIFRLPESDVHGGRRKVRCLCASGCLDGDQPIGHRPRAGDQSQEWRQSGQRTRELGTNDSKREYAACRGRSEITGKEGATRNPECGSEAFRATSSGDSENVAGRPGNTGNHDEAVRCITNNDQQHCELQDLEAFTIDAIIAGCESGQSRRPASLDWFRGVRDQCQGAGVDFFLKQAEVDGKVVEMPALDGVVHDALPWSDQ